MGFYMFRCGFYCNRNELASTCRVVYAKIDKSVGKMYKKMKSCIEQGKRVIVYIFGNVKHDGRMGCITRPSQPSQNPPKYLHRRLCCHSYYHSPSS